MEGLGICSAVLETLPQEGGVQCQVTLGEGLQSVDMLYSNATNIGPLPIVKAHQSQHNKSPPPIRAHSVRAQLTEDTLECSINSARWRSVGVISGMLGTERDSFRLTTKSSF